MMALMVASSSADYVIYAEMPRQSQPVDEA